MNEKIKKIATWDGWTFRNNGNTAEQYVDGEFMYGCHHWQSNPDCKIHLYLTDLNWLVPVAREVREELSKICVKLAHKHYRTISDAEMCDKTSDILILMDSNIWAIPINNEHTDLLNAVYEGIMLIEKYKQDVDKN